MTKEILEKYSKYCPQCRAYLANVYVECPDCKVPLGSSQRHHKIQIIKAQIAWVVVISALLIGTYGVQKNERINYQNALVAVFHGQFNSASEEFGKAFSINPTYLYITSQIDKMTPQPKKADNDFVIQ